MRFELTTSTLVTYELTQARANEDGIKVNPLAAESRAETILSS
jgi:hypothetical protein